MDDEDECLIAVSRHDIPVFGRIGVSISASVVVVYLGIVAHSPFHIGQVGS